MSDTAARPTFGRGRGRSHVAPGMRRLLLAGVLLAIIFLVVARSFTERWPYVVSLSPAPTRWLSEEPHGCSPVPAGTLAPPAGEVRASDYLLGPPDHVRVDLAGGPRRLEAPAPVTGVSLSVTRLTAPPSASVPKRAGTTPR